MRKQLLGIPGLKNMSASARSLMSFSAGQFSLVVNSYEGLCMVDDQKLFQNTVKNDVDDQRLPKYSEE